MKRTPYHIRLIWLGVFLSKHGTVVNCYTSGDSELERRLKLNVNKHLRKFCHVEWRRYEPNINYP